MDIAAITEGLAANASTVPGLHVHEFLPDSIVVPCFYTGEMDIIYDRSFGTLDEATITCRILASRADDRHGQNQLKQFLGRGVKSLKSALESDRTLGGACIDMHVRRVQGYRRYVVGADDFYGAELTVFVTGESES